MQRLVRRECTEHSTDWGGAGRTCQESNSRTGGKCLRDCYYILKQFRKLYLTSHPLTWRTVENLDQKGRGHAHCQENGALGPCCRLSHRLETVFQLISSHLTPASSTLQMPCPCCHRAASDWRKAPRQDDQSPFNFWITYLKWTIGPAPSLAHPSVSTDCVTPIKPSLVCPLSSNLQRPPSSQALPSDTGWTCFSEKIESNNLPPTHLTQSLLTPFPMWQFPPYESGNPASPSCTVFVKIHWILKTEYKKNWR